MKPMKLMDPTAFLFRAGLLTGAATRQRTRGREIGRDQREWPVYID
jgi:hypothetical protein